MVSGQWLSSGMYPGFILLPEFMMAKIYECTKKANGPHFFYEDCDKKCWNHIWGNGMIAPLPAISHWGRVTHICVGKLTIIASDNGLLPGRRQAIIWMNAWILLLGPLGTNFSEILIGIQTFLSKKMHLKMSSAKWRPFLSRPQCVKHTQFIDSIKYLKDIVSHS